MGSVLATGTGVPDPGRPFLRRTREADQEEIRARLVTASGPYLLGRLTVVVARSLGTDLATTRGAVTAGITTAAVRLLLPVLAGVLAGTIAEAPLSRWAVIAVVLGTVDAVGVRRHRASNPALRDFTALLETIEHDADLRRLVLFTRRWYRLRVCAAFSLVVSLTALLSFTLLAPAAFSALHVGSMVLLAVLVYEVAEITFFNVAFSVPFLDRLGGFRHRLFWLSPVDSPPIRRTVRAWGSGVRFMGVAITGYLALGILLVSLGSALLLPLVVVFTVLGYVATLVSLASLRRSIHTMVSRVRDENALELQRRIDGFRERIGRLSAEESDELHRLVEMYRTVRDSPTRAGSETVGHAAGALVVPTIGFFLALLSEVYAGRLLDQLLP